MAAITATSVGVGIDRSTGRVIAGWPDVLQAVEVIFTTAFGERVMRRYFGSVIPQMLGENLVPSTVLRVMTAIMVALEWEPRFALTAVKVVSSADELRAGKLRLNVEGIYRPRAHLGDFTEEGPKRVSLLFGEDGVSVT